MEVRTPDSAPTRLGVDNIFIQQNAALSFNKLQHRETFVEQQILHDVERCVSSLMQFITSKCILFQFIVKPQGKKVRNIENDASDHKICYKFA